MFRSPARSKKAVQEFNIADSDSDDAPIDRSDGHGDSFARPQPPPRAKPLGPARFLKPRSGNNSKPMHSRIASVTNRTTVDTPSNSKEPKVNTKNRSVHPRIASVTNRATVETPSKIKEQPAPTSPPVHPRIAGVTNRVTVDTVSHTSEQPVVTTSQPVHPRIASVTNREPVNVPAKRTINPTESVRSPLRIEQDDAARRLEEAVARQEELRQKILLKKIAQRKSDPKPPDLTRVMPRREVPFLPRDSFSTTREEVLPRMKEPEKSRQVAQPTYMMRPFRNQPVERPKTDFGSKRLPQSRLNKFEAIERQPETNKIKISVPTRPERSPSTDTISDVQRIQRKTPDEIVTELSSSSSRSRSLSPDGLRQLRNINKSLGGDAHTQAYTMARIVNAIGSCITGREMKLMHEQHVDAHNQAYTMARIVNAIFSLLTGQELKLMMEPSDDAHTQAYNMRRVLKAIGVFFKDWVIRKNIPITNPYNEDDEKNDGVKTLGSIFDAGTQPTRDSTSPVRDQTSTYDKLVTNLKTKYSEGIEFVDERLDILKENWAPVIDEFNERFEFVSVYKTSANDFLSDKISIVKEKSSDMYCKTKEGIKSQFSEEQLQKIEDCKNLVYDKCNENVQPHIDEYFTPHYQTVKDVGNRKVGVGEVKCYHVILILFAIVFRLMIVSDRRQKAMDMTYYHREQMIQEATSNFVKSTYNTTSAERNVNTSIKINQLRELGFSQMYSQQIHREQVATKDLVMHLPVENLTKMAPLRIGTAFSVGTSPLFAGRPFFTFGEAGEHLNDYRALPCVERNGNVCPTATTPFKLEHYTQMTTAIVKMASRNLKNFQLLWFDGKRSTTFKATRRFWQHALGPPENDLFAIDMFDAWIPDESKDIKSEWLVVGSIEKGRQRMAFINTTNPRHTLVTGLPFEQNHNQCALNLHPDVRMAFQRTKPDEVDTLVAEIGTRVITQVVLGGFVVYRLSCDTPFCGIKTHTAFQKAMQYEWHKTLFPEEDMVPHVFPTTEERSQAALNAQKLYSFKRSLELYGGFLPDRDPEAVPGPGGMIRAFDPSNYTQLTQFQDMKHMWISTIYKDSIPLGYKLTPVAKLLAGCNTPACQNFKESAPVTEAVRFEALSREDSVVLHGK